jgi:N-sulfoglucosamine sulfohydrolase
LRPLGYRVALSGKRHISPEEVFPFEYLGQGRNPDFELVEEFLAEVKENKEPFALMLTSNEPHTPWNKGDVSLFDPSEIQLPPHYIDTKETRVAFCKYLAEINYLDGQVGKALELLKKYSFEDNTLVIFASEQGMHFLSQSGHFTKPGLNQLLLPDIPE